MATEAQTIANRSNAQKSTGPRTPEGKERASQNALKHGLFAREAVIRGEDEDEFEMHRLRLLAQLNPVGPLEEMLADRIVDLSWRLQRAVQDQSEAFAALYERQTAGAEEAGNAAGNADLLIGSFQESQSGDWRSRAEMIGRMILEDFSQNAVLERLLRYERRIESSLYRTLNQLRRVHDQIQKAELEDPNILERWREVDRNARKARAFASCPPPEVSPGPAGGTTNTAVPGGAGWDGAAGTRDEGQMRKTNPNSAVAAVESPHYSNLPSFQHSSPQAGDERQMRKTNPNSEGVSSVKCHVLSGESALQTSDFTLDT